MKYVIIGSALSGNKGAAAMLESSIQTLSKDDEAAKFTLLSMYPSEDKQQNTYKNLSIIPAKPLQLGLVINPLALLYKIIPPARRLLLKKSKAIKALVEADALLDQGGITFTDGREKFLIYNIASILPALFVGTKVIKCAQALGPFKNPLNRAAAKVFLPKMALIVARGGITYKHLKALKLKNVTLGADYAFALDITPKEKASAQKLVDTSFFKGKVAGVCPSVVLHKKVEARGESYVQLMASFTNYLIDKKGYKVALVPHSVRTNTDKTHNNDLPLCREIYNLVKSKEKCLFIDKEMGSQELRYLIGQCDLFVASRFHAMISSLSMKVPTLVIGWSHKYQEVLDMFELKEWAFGHDKLNLGYLIERFEELEKAKTDITDKLNRFLPQVKKLSIKHTDFIEGVVNGKDN